ncbi:WhiB family transcriptional regulator [Streptosporangium lutulentum]
MSLAPRLHAPADWIAAKGLCTRPGADPDRWFPEEPIGKNQRLDYEQEAKARCFGCKAKVECLEVALIEETPSS